MNSRPMILRLRSGSRDALELRPGSAARRRRTRPSGCSRSAKRRRTCCASSLRSRPLSTNTQVSRSPIARWTRSAATAESTPPERAQITRPFGPTCSRIRSVASSTKERAFQSRRQPQTSRKFDEDLRALLGVDDLGVELDAVETARADPRSRRSRWSRWRRPPGSPAGALRMSSPWLIQTRLRGGSPRKSVPPGFGEKTAWPYSRWPGALHLAAEHVAHELHAVADARAPARPSCEDPRVAARRAPLVDAVGAAGEHDAPRAARGQGTSALRARGQDLGVDLQLAQPARDELGVLRAEVEDEDGLSLHGRPGSWIIPSRAPARPGPLAPSVYSAGALSRRLATLRPCCSLAALRGTPRPPPRRRCSPLAAAWKTLLGEFVVPPLATDGRRVYVATRDGAVRALDLATGAVAWKAEGFAGRLSAGRRARPRARRGRHAVEPAAPHRRRALEGRHGRRGHRCPPSSTATAPSWPAAGWPPSTSPAGASLWTRHVGRGDHGPAGGRRRAPPHRRERRHPALPRPRDGRLAVDAAHGRRARSRRRSSTRPRRRALPRHHRQAHPRGLARRGRARGGAWTGRARTSATAGLLLPGPRRSSPPSTRCSTPCAGAATSPGAAPLPSRPLSAPLARRAATSSSPASRTRSSPSPPRRGRARAASARRPRSARRR